ncbi:thiamine diphosphokinase [soil metagenome]
MAATPTDAGPPRGSSGSELVVVVTGGAEPGPAERAVSVPDRAVVVAADSGVARAQELGLVISAVVGDLDSVSDAQLDAVRAAGGTVERHPRAKDETDLELALNAALTHAPARLLVLGGHGGRVDHFLANLLALAGPALADTAVEARMGTATVTVVRPGRTVQVQGEIGDLVSLLPVHGAAVGVHTNGLVFALAGETLAAGSTRGVSNELAVEAATVSLGAGVLVVVQPGPVAEHVPTRPSARSAISPTTRGATR